MQSAAPLVVTLEEAGFEGELYLPVGRERFELCVIVLGGSGGGLLHRDSAAALSAAGIPALALAYFNCGKLPRKMEQIPLEYFEHAAQWLRARAELGGARVVLMGRSRGAELSLQLAATYPQFEGVIATSPSHVLWPAPGSGGVAWTFRGRALPAVQYRLGAPPPLVQHVDGKDYLVLTDPSHFQLRDNPTVQAATIAVENIRGPVLLFSGRDDLLWASSYFADRIEERARSRGLRFALDNVQYDGVGHDFPLPGQPPNLRAIYPGAPSGVAFGGEPEAIARAAEDRWRRILSYLRALGS